MRPVDPRLLRHAAARAGLVAAVALGLVTAATVLGQAWLLARVIAGVSEGAGLDTVRAALAGLAGVVLLRAAAGAGGELMAARAATATQQQLRHALVRRAVRLGPDWLVRRGTGELTTLATRGLDPLDAWFARFLPQLVYAAVIPAAAVLLLAGADWPSAVAVALMLPLVPLFMVLVGLQTQARTDRQWDLLQRLGGHFLDVVEGLPTLTVFRRARAQVEAVRRITDQHRQETMAALRAAFLSALVLELLATLATAVVAVEVGLRLLSGDLPYQTALFVLLLTPEAFLPLRRVGAEFHASREGTLAAARALDVLDEPVSAPAGDRPAPAGELVELDRVCLRYPGRDLPALDRVSVTLRRGELVVLLGPSGAGKSSLLGLLLRFIEATTGDVLVDGGRLSEVDAEAWRRRVAWMPQRSVLLAGTVEDNVRLGAPAATTAQLDRAAALADLVGLPAGWDTPVGEGGLRLSSGQRQRVGLARTFLRVLADDVPVLLLDEPTAHLDGRSAARVRSSVVAAAADRITVVVTHDLAWAAVADRVMRIDGGRLVASALPRAGSVAVPARRPRPAPTGGFVAGGTAPAAAR